MSAAATGIAGRTTSRAMQAAMTRRRMLAPAQFGHGARRLIRGDAGTNKRKPAGMALYMRPPRLDAADRLVRRRRTKYHPTSIIRRRLRVMMRYQKGSTVGSI